MPIRILVIEDEAHIADFLRMGLSHEGYLLETTATAHDGLAKASEFKPDLVILDLMLPDGDGYEVCGKLRAMGDFLILMLTARDALADRVKGLELGADDYLTKPFHFEELLARIRVLFRRMKTETPSREIRLGDLTLNAETRVVRRGDRDIPMTAREFDLLRLLMSHPHRVFERGTLLEMVWDDAYERESNVVDVYIRRLRDKVDREGEEPPLIHTVRGVGYVMRG